MPGEAARLAGWWRRLAGYILDGIIVEIVYYILALVFGALGAHALGAVLGYAVDIGYWTYFVGRDGATLGMRILGMRVVAADGRPALSYVDALVRFLMMIVGGVCLGLGYLWAAWDPRRQAWHDHVARTLVVMA